jgi:hypothetical protein
VFDPDLQAWRVLTANWGDNLSSPLNLRHTIYRGEILHGLTILEVGDPLALSGNADGVSGCYDGCLVYDASASRWLIAYAQVVEMAWSDFHPRLDYSADLVTFTNLFNAASGSTEGTQIVKIGGTNYVTAGNGGSFPVYSISGTVLGNIQVDKFPSPGGSNPPHFIIFPKMTGAVTSYYALSWQNTDYKPNGSDKGHNSVGSLVVYKAEQTESGFAFNAIGIS